MMKSYRSILAFAGLLTLAISLPATAADSRLLKDIAATGEEIGPAHVQVVTFVWKVGGERQRGLLAQDVARVVPECVAASPKAEGFLAIDFRCLVDRKYLTQDQADAFIAGK